MRITARPAIAAAIALAVSAGIAAPSHAATPSAARTGAPTTLSKDGIVKVGVGIAPGTYFGTLRSDVSLGRYSRLKCKTDNGKCQIDIGFVGKGQQVIVAIKKSDAYFANTGMSWVPAARAPRKVASTTAIAASGIYRVGIDLKPGKWRASVKKGLVGTLGTYQRLKCVDAADLSCSIESKTVLNTKPVTVKILASDKYFRTAGFGTWKRIGS